MTDEIITLFVADVFALIHSVIILSCGWLLFQAFGITANSENVQTALLVFIIFATHSNMTILKKQHPPLTEPGK